MTIDYLFNEDDCDIECTNCEKKILCNIVHVVPNDDDDNSTWLLCSVCMMLMIDGDTLNEYAPEWDTDFGRNMIDMGNNLQTMIDAIKNGVNESKE